MPRSVGKSTVHMLRRGDGCIADIIRTGMTFLTKQRKGSTNANYISFVSKRSYTLCVGLPLFNSCCVPGTYIEITCFVYHAAECGSALTLSMGLVTFLFLECGCCVLWSFRFDAIPPFVLFFKQVKPWNK